MSVVRRSRVLLLAALALPLVVAVSGQRGPSAVAAAREPVARLGVGGAAFWPGSARPVVEQSGAVVRDYGLVVAPGAARLRVAFDHPDFRVGFVLSLVNPSGTTVGRQGGYNSTELYALAPRAGTWTVRVETFDASYTDFRLRAKLERTIPKPAGKRPLLPNLQLVPPYEFTFSGSLGSLGGIGSTGVPAGSCTANDLAEFRPTRCLRFSLGPANVGEGPLELRFASGEGLVTPGRAKQAVHWSDGSVRLRDAGDFQYHHTHAHYHHTGFGSLELLKVTNRARGTMTKAGSGPKQGFCTADVMIAEWTKFTNGPPNGAESQCISELGPTGTNNPTGTQMALTAGWVDIYSWEQDGNYVDFGLNTDGYYVVRSTADALGHVLESNERDNTSYSYIQVTGTTIRVLERGYGTGPWDRAKRIARDNLHPTA